VKAAAVNPADILFRDPGWPNMTSNIGDCGSQSSAPRRRRAGAAHRSARCLGGGDVVTDVLEVRFSYDGEEDRHLAAASTGTRLAMRVAAVTLSRRAAI
jgi:hypothetical protein